MPTLRSCTHTDTGELVSAFLPQYVQVLYNDANRLIDQSSYLKDTASFVKGWNALQTKLSSGETYLSEYSQLE